MCDYVAATNVSSVDSEYACDPIEHVPTSDFCLWDGIGCDNGSIVALYTPKATPRDSRLKSMGGLRQALVLQTMIGGSLPDSLGHLTSLTVLDLSHNLLFSSVPSSFGLLSNLLGLSLQYNSLSYALPDSLGGMSQLTQLGVQYNSFSGAIPASISQLALLTVLTLRRNRLSSNIPDEMGAMPGLQVHCHNTAHNMSPCERLEKPVTVHKHNYCRV